MDGSLEREEEGSSSKALQPELAKSAKKPAIKDAKQYASLTNLLSPFYTHSFLHTLWLRPPLCLMFADSLTWNLYFSQSSTSTPDSSMCWGLYNSLPIHFFPSCVQSELIHVLYPICFIFITHIFPVYLFPSSLWRHIQCKRLKLKCDRRTPCDQCMKRETTQKCVYQANAADCLYVPFSFLLQFLPPVSTPSLHRSMSRVWTCYSIHLWSDASVSKSNRNKLKMSRCSTGLNHDFQLCITLHPTWQTKRLSEAWIDKEEYQEGVDRSRNLIRWCHLQQKTI